MVNFRTLGFPMLYNYVNKIANVFLFPGVGGHDVASEDRRFLARAKAAGVIPKSKGSTQRS
jgi:hypothetical protein